jgi:translation initiation factor 2 gamma subunit (eIF-2gamma)
MKTLFASLAAVALMFSLTACESHKGMDMKDGCACKETCTCPHCGKTADKCVCPKPVCPKCGKTPCVCPK